MICSAFSLVYAVQAAVFLHAVIVQNDVANRILSINIMLSKREKRDQKIFYV